MSNARQLSDILAGASLVGIGGAFFIGAMRLPPNPFSPLDPHVVPMAAAGILTVIGLALVVGNSMRALREYKAPRHAKCDGEDGNDEISGGAGWGAIALMVFLTVAYVWLVQAVGYLLATLLLSPVLFAVFGVSNWKHISLASIIASALLYVTFALGLRIHLPSGWALQF